MPFELVLNALWACVALCAVSVFLWAEARSRAPRSRRILAVVFALLFLFPCVSESDDLLSLAKLQFALETGDEAGNPVPQPSGGAERTGHYLARLFDSLGTFPITAIYALLLTLLCVALVLAPRTFGVVRSQATPTGRAPPLTLLSSL